MRSPTLRINGQVKAVQHPPMQVLILLPVSLALRWTAKPVVVHVELGHGDFISAQVWSPACGCPV